MQNSHMSLLARGVSTVWAAVAAISWVLYLLGVEKAVMFMRRLCNFYNATIS